MKTLLAAISAIPRPKTVPKSCAVALALAGLAAASLAQDASVDLELRGNEKVSGTLRPAFATESFACRIPRGATLSAAVKSKLKGLTAPPFDVGLTRDGTPVPDSPFAVKGPARSLAGHVAAESGLFRVVVTGDGNNDGDFDLSLAVKPAKSFSQTGALDAAAETDIVFGGPAGAVATIDAKPASGSGFAGGIVTIRHPSGGYQGFADPAARQTVTLDGTGDATVTLRNVGATGAYSFTVKLRLPKVGKGKIDIRDGELTIPFGDEPTVFGRVLGPEGGTLELPPAPSPLEGSSISIPAGVLAGSLVVTISSAPSLPDQSGRHPGGPAVEFGPAGTVFAPEGSDPSRRATLTIPYDPAAFPNGTDSMIVYVRDALGVVTAVPKPYLIGANTVSFTTSHLSSYQAQSSGPRLFAGDFLALELVNELSNSFGGSFGFGLHSVGVSQGVANVSNDGLTISWRTGESAGFVEQETESDAVSFDAVVDPADDSIVTFTDPAQQEGTKVFRRGPDGDVLIAEGESIVLLRRAVAPPTVSLVAGRWHLVHLALFAQQIEGANPSAARLEFEGDRGVLDLVPDGSVRFRSLVSVSAATGFTEGTWEQTGRDGGPPTIRWEIVDGTIRLLGEELGDEPTRLFPVLDGNVLVGRNTRPEGQTGSEIEVELFLLVRATSGFSIDDAVGDYFNQASTVQTRDSDTIPQGVITFADHLTVTIPPSGDSTHSGSQQLEDHQSDGVASFNFRLIDLSTAGRFTVKSDGSFTTDFDGAGAFTPNGALYIRTRFIPTRFGLGFSVRKP